MKMCLNTKTLLILMVCPALYLLSANKALSAGADSSFTGHVFYGQMVMSMEDSNSDEEDIDVFIFGADAQKSMGGEIVTYGFETGALFSFDSSARYLGASSGSGGGSVAVSVDVNSFLIDYFAGGFLAFEPTGWLRLSVGAGPLLIWSSWDIEPKESSDENINPESDSGFGAGVYARAGIDVFFTEKIGVNAGVRMNETTLTLESSTGKIDVEGWQYYFGLALHF